MLADLQCDHTIGMELKNYPKLTSHMLKSINTNKMRTTECIILEKEGSKNGLHPHFDAPGQKSVKMSRYCLQLLAIASNY